MQATRKVPFLDLRITDDAERRALLDAVDRVFRHGRIVLGPEVAELEGSVARLCGRRYCAGVNSGTDALYLALRAFKVGHGDEVITTALSWVATANAIALTGATPVFADIRDDLNINPDSVRSLVGSRTKCILPVHYTGKVCDMTALGEIARRHKLLVLEDASQCFSARHRGGVAGSFGDAAAFSLNPMKVFAACGEAGLVVTDDEALMQRLEFLRYNGCVNRETCVEPSLNGRLDTVQAAVLLERLKRVDGVVERRRRNAALYRQGLSGKVVCPADAEGDRDVYYTFTIQTDRRDALKEFLVERGVETKIQHPLLMPQQPAYAAAAKGDYPNALRLAPRVLCLPVHEKLSPDDVEYVCDCVLEFTGK